MALKRKVLRRLTVLLLASALPAACEAPAPDGSAHPPQPGPGATLFADGFESGNGSAWNSALGNSSYPTRGCRSGAHCGAKTLAAGVGQQSPYWAKEFTYGGETLYASAWWRFPVGYSWNAAPGEESFNHKLMIFNVPDGGSGRFHVVLTGGGSSPTFFITAERTDPKPPGIRHYSEVHWPPDGRWHRVELELRRTAGTAGRARVWLDGELAIDEKGRICGTPCQPIIGVEFGAYVNQGSATSQTFYMDDVLIRGGPRPG